MTVTQVAGVEGVKFDLSKMGQLGSPASNPRTFIVTKHALHESFDQAVDINKN